MMTLRRPRTSSRWPHCFPYVPHVLSPYLYGFCNTFSSALQLLKPRSQPACRIVSVSVVVPTCLSPQHGEFQTLRRRSEKPCPRSRLRNHVQRCIIHRTRPWTGPENPFCHEVRILSSGLRCLNERICRFPGQENGDFKIPSVVCYAQDGRILAVGAEARHSNLDPDEEPVFVEWCVTIRLVREVAKQILQVQALPLPSIYAASWSQPSPASTGKNCRQDYRRFLRVSFQLCAEIHPRECSQR